MNRRQMLGAVAAAAAAGLFGTNASAGDPKGDAPKAEKSFKCIGGNSCKGKSECGVPGGHGCHGQNSCKGKGWIMVSSEKECQDIKAAMAKTAKAEKQG